MPVPSSRQRRLAALLAASVALSAAPISAYTCLDESGSPVDWFVGLPSGSDSPGYYYVDSNTVKGGFVLSPYGLDVTSGGSIMSTVNQLYGLSNVTGTVYAAWNDDPPTGQSVSSTYAHAKGVLLSSGVSGFWLVHSKPAWPNAISQGAAPFPDLTYAQSVMCVTLDPADVDNVAAVQTVNFPYIYDSILTPDLADEFPHFGTFVSKTKTTKTSITTALDSTAGWSSPVDLMAIGKGYKWGKDLYEDLVSPTLGDSLYVETWRDGAGGRMPSFCPGSTAVDTRPVNYTVYFVNDVTMPDGVSWTGTKDHSKWAVTMGTSAGASKWACVGDINRMCSQESRGGGTLCMQDDDLWEAFTNAVSGYDACWDYDVCQTSYQCYWCPPVVDQFTALLRGGGKQ